MFLIRVNETELFHSNGHMLCIVRELLNRESVLYLSIYSVNMRFSRIVGVDDLLKTW